MKVFRKTDVPIHRGNMSKRSDVEFCLRIRTMAARQCPAAQKTILREFEQQCGPPDFLPFAQCIQILPAFLRTVKENLRFAGRFKPNDGGVIDGQDAIIQKFHGGISVRAIENILHTAHIQRSRLHKLALFRYLELYCCPCIFRAILIPSFAVIDNRHIGRQCPFSLYGYRDVLFFVSSHGFILILKFMSASASASFSRM